MFISDSLFSFTLSGTSCDMRNFLGQSYLIRSCSANPSRDRLILKDLARFLRNTVNLANPCKMMLILQDLARGYKSCKILQDAFKIKILLQDLARLTSKNLKLLNRSMIAFFLISHYLKVIA